jgi:hypothetical protein
MKEFHKLSALLIKSSLVTIETLVSAQYHCTTTSVPHTPIIFQTSYSPSGFSLLGYHPIRLPLENWIVELVFMIDEEDHVGN